ncbi:MAG TPA: class I SAM-dependent methyltransferase [Thermoplasmata archaeon]|nr:class I SAM-dependent methyltransferase [Thermoplasmata archaeon]
MSRTLPWREAARDADALRPMLLDQFRHEDLRGRVVLDLGTGEGRLAFVSAAAGARVIGVDLDRAKLQHARAYAAVRDIRNADFVWGDVEKTPYHEFSPNPIDAVTSNLCMSPEIVWHASRALRPEGTFIFCCHHGDHWKETRRGSRWAFYEDTMTDLLEENRLAPEFVGVDTTVARFDELREVELFLPGETVRRWAEDGRWEELADSFAGGDKGLTLSYLVVKARRTRAPYAVE